MACRRLLLSLCLVWLAGISQLQALPLWELEGTGNQIRLLGSIHFLRSSDYPLPAAFGESYKAADVIVMELDLAKLDPLETMSVMQRLAVDPGGRSLQDALGTRTYQNARRKASDIDIDLAAMQSYEPWYAALQITQMRLQQLGFDASYGIESRVILLAVQDGKEVTGLETIEEQLASLDSLPANAQRAFLMQTLDEAKEVSDKLDDIIVAWRTGNVKVLERELLGGLQEQPELYERLLMRRNKNWSRQIAEFADDSKDYLIIVGALHLVGEDSVLKMLNEMGYSSRQIR